MVDGPAVATNLDETEPNRALVRAFVDEVLVAGQLDKLEHYINTSCFVEHNPHLSDDLSGLRSALSGGGLVYDRMHRLLADGNFVLSVCEGARHGKHSSLYDLFRLAEGKIVEHWDTSEFVPPRSEWKNDNGKF